MSLPDVETFLNFLGQLNTTGKEIHSGAVLDREGVGVLKGLGVIHGTVEEWCRWGSEVEGKGTLHVCLNRTNLRGRQKGDIVEPRVVCVDIDDEVSEGFIEEVRDSLVPHLIVCSSPGKYHCYWLIGRGWKLERWSKIITGVNALLGGDLMMGQVNRTIRVPGISRVGKNGEKCIPYIVSRLENAAPYTEGEILDLFPGCIEAGVSGLKALREARGKAARGARGLEGCEAVARVGRNESLYSFVYAWAQANPGLTLEEAEEAGRGWHYEVCPDNPLSEEEIEKTVKSAWAKGASKVEELNEKVEEVRKEEGKKEGSRTITVDAPIDDGDEFDNEAIKAASFSDSALLERVLAEYGDKMVRVNKRVLGYNPNTAIWEVQNGEYHPLLSGMCKSESLRIINSEKWIANIIKKGGKKAPTEAVEDARNIVLSMGKQNSLVRGLLNYREIAELVMDDFDANPEVIAVRNGLLNIRTKELRAIDSMDLVMSRSYINWEADAECSGWVKFLDEIFEGDNGTIEFVQQMFGYSLSGYVSEQRVFIHYGMGSNGKSKLMSALLAIAGGMGTFIDPDDFSSGDTRGLRFERVAAKMENRRVAVIDDMDLSGVLNETFLKNCTAQIIRARAEYEQSREISNRCVVHMCVNDFNMKEDAGHGVMRRLQIIQYSKRFDSKGSVGNEIDAMIRREAPGILKWAVEGYAKYSEVQELPYHLLDTTAVDITRDGCLDVSDIVRQMYALSNEGDGITLNQIVKDLKVYARDTLMKNVKISPTQVGMTLREVFSGIEMKRVQKDKERVRVFPLIRT